MKIVLFNPLSGLQVRGISKVADELASELIKNRHEVIEVKIPKHLYPFANVLKIIVFILYQQLICPIIAIKNRADLIIDPYNGFSIIGSFFIKTKYFIHDYTPFKRKFWYFRPGTIYQLLMFKLDAWFGLADLYHDSLNIDTPHFLERSLPPRFFPCIVKPLDKAESSFYHENISFHIAQSGHPVLIISTISGPGWNKDFSGLVENLKMLDKEFFLIAFGFGDTSNQLKEIVMRNGRISRLLIVGFVAESAIASTIAHSDLFVFHSVSEGFGRPIPEALQLKKVIVTTENAPVLHILSNEAKCNIFTYKQNDDFTTAVEQGIASTFKPFKNMYKDDIDLTIDAFLV